MPDLELSVVELKPLPGSPVTAWPTVGPTAPMVFVCTPVILPTNPPRPCPELLTADEAVVYLRLDTIDTKYPGETLRYYREKGQLRGTQVGKAVFYRRVELDAFLARATDENPR